MQFETFKSKLSMDVGGTFAPDPWFWSTGETESTATPVDLTGCTAEMHVRDKLNSPVILMTLSTSNGRIILGGIAGSIALRVTDEDTALVDWKSGVYDVRLTFPNGDSIFFVEGTISAEKRVTRNG